MVSIVCYWMKETKSNRDSLHAWEVPEVGESPRSGSLRGREVSEVGDFPRSETSGRQRVFESWHSSNEKILCL